MSLETPQSTPRLDPTGLSCRGVFLGWARLRSIGAPACPRATLRATLLLLHQDCKKQIGDTVQMRYQNPQPRGACKRPLSPQYGDERNAQEEHFRGSVPVGPGDSAPSKDNTHMFLLCNTTSTTKNLQEHVSVHTWNHGVPKKVVCTTNSGNCRVHMQKPGNRVA